MPCQTRNMLKLLLIRLHRFATGLFLATGPSGLQSRFQQGSNLLAVVELERLEFSLASLRHRANHPQTRVVHRELLILGQALFQRQQPMLDKLVSSAVFKFVQMSLQVRSCHLAPGSDRARKHLLRHSRWLEFEKMCSKLVDASHQEPYAIWPLAVVLCICLRAVADHVDYSFDWYWSAVCHLRGERLLFHEVR